MSAMEERKERPNAILGAFIGLVILLAAVQVQTTVRQTNTERRITSAEGKLDRLESWLVQDRQLQSQRHEDVMAVLAGINASETKSVTTLEFIVNYYKRAESR